MLLSKTQSDSGEHLKPEIITALQSNGCNTHKEDNTQVVSICTIICSLKNDLVLASLLAYHAYAIPMV